MEKGTLLIKVNGREEGYWIAVVAACWAVMSLTSHLHFDNVGIAAAGVILCAAVILRFTLLRTWHIRTVKWTLDETTLTLNGEVIPRNTIVKVFFERNKLSSSSWYLNIRTDRNIRLESLSSRRQKAESVASLEALAYALRPDLNRKAR